MAESGERIQIVLRWVQILDKLEPAFKERGEFRFTARVTADGTVTETRFPPEGHYEISDHPAWNRLNLDEVIYEGAAPGTLEVELHGEELDFLSANDRLEDYRRAFSGPASSYIGRHCPGDEGEADPENLTNWRVCYEVLRA